MGDLDEDYEVENALRTYPLEPAPPALAPSVMSRIRTLAPLPRFRLSWVDLVASAFVAGMIGLAALLWQFLPPQLAARTQLQFLQLTHHVNSPLFLMAALAGVGLAVFALLVAAAVFARGRSSSNS